MPHNKVKIDVTFVTMKPGTTSTILIDDPTDLTDAIGGISSYSKLQDAINYLVEDDSYSLFFHLNSLHKYSFDGTTIQNDAIYVRKQKRSDRDGGKVTARNLVHIQSESDSKDNIDSAGKFIYKKRASTRNSRQSEATHKNRKKYRLFFN